jgi:hypothetical protein
MRKNVASQKLTFALVNASTGAALTSASVTARRSIDGGAQATADGAVTELGNGQYLFSPSQADTNGDSIGYLFTATSAIPVNIHVFTTAGDPSDTVRFGLTALPNATPAGAGGLATVDASNQIAGVQGTINNLNNLDAAITTRSSHSAADVWAVGTRTLTSFGTLVADIWNALTSGMTTAGSIGKKLADWVVGTIDTYTGNTKQTGDAFARLGAPAGASVSADVAAVKSDTAAVLDDTGTSGVVVAAGSKTGYGLADGAITSLKFAASAIDAAALATDAANEIRDAIKALVIEAEGNYTVQQALSVILAVLAGVTASSGATIKTPNGAATRVAATINASQERTAMTLTPSS